MSHSSSYLHAIINEINKIKNSDKATRDYYHYKNNSGLSLGAIKILLGSCQPQWRYINNALKIGVAKGHLKKTKGRYKVIKIKQSKKKSRRRAKTVAQKRADCKKKNLIYDKNTGRCRVRKKPGRKLKKSHVKSRKPKKAVKKKKMKKSKFKMRPTKKARISGSGVLFDCNKLAKTATGHPGYTIPESVRTNSGLLVLTDEEMIALMQSAINVVPSIQGVGYRYICLANLFPESFNLCKKVACDSLNGGKFKWIDNYKATLISYSNFEQLLLWASKRPQNAKSIEGLYPVAHELSDADGGTHYYIVIATDSIKRQGLEKPFIKWFTERGQGTTQSTQFVENALQKFSCVVLNGYKKGWSNLDNVDIVKNFAFGANIQPMQALCCFNAATLGVAWGLETAFKFVASCARKTCLSLELYDIIGRGGDAARRAEHNERAVLTFLGQMFHFTGVPSQPLGKAPYVDPSTFTYSLATGAGDGSTTANFVPNLIQKLLSINSQPDHDLTLFSEDGKDVLILGVFQVFLCQQFGTQFKVWSAPRGQGGCGPVPLVHGDSLTLLDIPQDLVEDTDRYTHNNPESSSSSSSSGGERRMVSPRSSLVGTSANSNDLAGFDLDALVNDTTDRGGYDSDDPDSLLDFGNLSGNESLVPLDDDMDLDDMDFDLVFT